MLELTLYSKHNVQKGFNFLSRKDEKLAKLIISNPNFSLPKKCTGFKALLKTIISQQLSTSAANSIWTRIIKNNLTSGLNILKAEQQLLLTLGLSRQKCIYVKELSLIHI